tara:strand:- start:66 stop:482 length:417 start_codon:yes stop_codon:yes gene_type:complete
MTANKPSPIVLPAKIPTTARLYVHFGNDIRPATVEDLAFFGYTKKDDPAPETPSKETPSKDSNQVFTDFGFDFILPSSEAAEKITSFLEGLFTSPEPDEGKTSTNIGKDFYQGLADMLDRYRSSGEQNDSGKSGPTAS